MNQGLPQQKFDLIPGFFLKRVIYFSSSALRGHSKIRFFSAYFLHYGPRFHTHSVLVRFQPQNTSIVNFMNVSDSLPTWMGSGLHLMICMSPTCDPRQGPSHKVFDLFLPLLSRENLEIMYQTLLFLVLKRRSVDPSCFGPLFPPQTQGDSWRLLVRFQSQKNPF